MNKLKTKKTLHLSLSLGILLATQISTQNLSAALTCPVANQAALDWDAPAIDWPTPVNLTNGPGDYTPDLNESFVVGGITFDFAISGDSTMANLIRSFEERADVAEDTPDDVGDVVGPGDTDGNGSIDAALDVIINSTDTSNNPIDIDVILDVTLSEPVSELEFSISDIDHSDPGTRERQDVVTVTGSYMSNAVTPTLTPEYTVTGPTDPGLTVSANTATAQLTGVNVFPTGTGNQHPDRGTVFVKFSTPVDAITIVYADGVEAGADLGGTRGISIINDTGFCYAPDVSGSVFEDADGDGVFSAGDVALSGVSVQIFEADASGNPIGGALDTQLTDVNGAYSFIDLLPDDYVIIETDPGGYVSVTDIEGDTTDPAYNRIPVSLGSVNVTGQNFLDIQSADLRVVKDDSSLTYTPGTSGTYTITVTNLGPSDVSGATIQDILPLGVTLNGAVTCVASGAASCSSPIGTTGDPSFSDLAISIDADASEAVNFVTYTVPVVFSSDMNAY
ncbi:MAG: DUF11 domain-containing protein [Gammaproteobacteria bacterium]|nr:DUF11 domain-containing protein [Gammaproteobacteria bacterium]